MMAMHYSEDKTFTAAAAKKSLLLLILVSVSVLCAESNPSTSTSVPKHFGNTIPTNATFHSFSSPPMQKFRYFPPNTGPQTCCLIKEVPKGHFFVRIFFGVVFHDMEPIFDISVEGTQISSLQSGWTHKDSQEFAEALLVLQDGAASLCFHSTCRGAPAILEIEILQINEEAYSFGPNWSQGVILRTVTRLSCGADEPMFEDHYNGSRLGGSRFWTPIKNFGKQSDRVISTNTNIKLTLVSPNFYPEALYQSALVGTESQPSLNYSMDVFSNRNYTIWFHFAEINDSIGVGQRIFDVLVNDVPKFNSVDVFRLTGGPYTALVLHVTVAISERKLTITFRPRQGSHAMINALEVFEVLSMEVKTSSEEVRALRRLKKALTIPLCHGWIGDPCAPQEHSWNGVHCNKVENNWVIDALTLDNLGLVGFLPNIASLDHLRIINLSGNSLYGPIPASVGTLTELEVLDMSYNLLSGSIPESLGQLKSLKILNLNGNSLSERVPAALHKASFNGNVGVCGIYDLPACGSHHSSSAIPWIALAASFMFFVVIIFVVCCWKRRNPTRDPPPYVNLCENIEMTMQK